ncbi:hypothetical protein ERO13_A08G228900v2 [Gossypium hirsutum]|uniref:Uncharacterized protein n=1 Tax=Gossypium mustelinum TaxID=34275 RepID=A0A5D2YD19_GOSMU|nr:hypothetical protein ERO13_A08G228900v2 [Gossypium hirsutum]TYJ24365.1 hypothetical protein E1A91_A08G255100v1 [Gossypium mustelinum]
MEEYLQYMKTLRSQINDVEDQAANVSAEEQIHFTTIQTLQNDILSAKSMKQQLIEDIEKMLTAKGQLCSLIIEKQRKIASLDSDSTTLAQTLELIQHEKISLSSKLLEKSAYYSKVVEDLSCKLQQQQDWVKSQKHRRQMEEHDLVNNKLDEKMTESEGNISVGNCLITDNEIKESIEQAKLGSNHFKPELLEISVMALEEEYKALLSDKDGETEYLCSLQDHLEQIKGISHVIKCACGEEYMLDLRA